MGRIPIKKRFTILFSLFVLSATLCSAQKVSLNFNGQSLRNVLESITEQTNHSLAFSKEVVDLSDAVSIRVTDTDMTQVLNQLLSPRNIGYEIRDNKIYIFEKPEANAPQQDQDVTIRGTVTDDLGELIIGANVVVPGSILGRAKRLMSLHKGITPY